MTSRYVLECLDSYPSAVAPPKVHSDDARLRRVLAEHFDVTWRLLRRLGVPEREIDDAIQEVILVLSRKLECVEPERERSFVLGTAYRVASTLRRTLRRRREVDPEPIAALTDEAGTPESLLEQRRARALLDSALDALSPDSRAVFVFYDPATTGHAIPGAPSPDTPPVSPPRSTRERVGGRAHRRVPASLPSAVVENEPPSESANTGFAEELALVDQARAELARGNARSVLTAIERYQARYPRGGFHPEMLALAVDALVLSGDRERARAASRRFLAQFPKHPLANRVQNQASK